MGRLAPVKGLRVLLQALESLIVDYPDLHLTLIGDGPDRAELERLASPLGKSVTFTGYMSQAEVAEAMRQCDIFVLPSFAEGVPVVLMEALASGRPVVATAVAGVSELVEEGRSGFIVPPGDPVALADGIRKLADDPALRDAMGQVGREKVLLDFDIAKEAARLALLFSGQAPSGAGPAISGDDNR